MLSVLIPVYNEIQTLEEIVNQIQAVDIDKELVIVDDGSNDGSREFLKELKVKHSNINLIFHDKNRGKGGAIRTAIANMKGDIAIVQDADLEYDPKDYIKLIEPIQKGEEKVIYGSRFLDKTNKHSYFTFYVGGLIVTTVTNILFFQKLTDEPTCYKVFDAAFLKSIPLKCEGFEFCPEVTAKVAKRGIKIKELPIQYYPRTLDEGKKITAFDGVIAIWTLLKYRIMN